MDHIDHGMVQVNPKWITMYTSQARSKNTLGTSLDLNLNHGMKKKQANGNPNNLLIIHSKHVFKGNNLRHGMKIIKFKHVKDKNQHLKEFSMIIQAFNIKNN